MSQWGLGVVRHACLMRATALVPAMQGGHMPQERSRIVRQAHDDVQEQGSAQRVKGDESNIDELDSVLDDIETSLSENAEEYVNRFVQKGGE